MTPREVSAWFTKHLRRLVARDLGETQRQPDVSALFNLGTSGGSDIAREKDDMIGEAFAAARAAQSRRRPLT